MSVQTWQRLLMAALLDPCRATDLLHGRTTAYAGFDLSASETAILQTIQAETLVEYATCGHRLLYGEDLLQEDECPAGQAAHESAQRDIA